MHAWKNLILRTLQISTCLFQCIIHVCNRDKNAKQSRPFFFSSLKDDHRMLETKVQLINKKVEAYDFDFVLRYSLRKGYLNRRFDEETHRF